MKTKFLLYLLTASLLLIAGCTGGNTTTGTGYSPFIGGSDGLEMTFISSAPPDEVYDNDKFPFSVTVELENLGEYDILNGDGFIEIRGISAEEFGVTSADLKKDIPEIQGARKSSDGTILKGLVDVISFDGLAYQQDLAGDLPINNLRVRACYDYETKASAQLCLKPNGHDGLKDDEICIIAEGKQVANSAAPLHIANVKEHPRGDDGVMISFDIVHQGNSNFKWFAPGDNECDDTIGNSQMYALDIEVESIVNGRYNAECARLGGSNRGELVLTRGAPQSIVCTFNTGNQDVEFETPVNINLRYRYSEYIEKQILIKDLGITNN